MTKKRRCPNCGAYISAGDKMCYVCGEKIAPVSAPRNNAGKKRTYSPVTYEPDQGSDYVLPADHSAETRQFTRKKPSKPAVDPAYEDNYDDPFVSDRSAPYFYDENEDFDGRRRNKKILIACVAVVIAAALAASVFGILAALGVFAPKNNDGEITIYFDKPSVNINLLDDQGEVYNWGADVTVNYKLKDKEEEQSASPCAEYDNMWKCTVPAKAEELYFSQTTGVEIRTEFVKMLENDTVYYATDILLNSDDRLPIGSCPLNDFDNLGVNAVFEPATTVTTKPTEATQKETEEESETEEETEEETEKETEKETEALDNPYNISVPSSWANGTTEIDNGNCISFYEKYNYKKSGSGMLLSIYTFKAGDNSYGDLNAKKVLTASDGSKVVVVTPTDVEFDVDDEKAMSKYTALSSLTNQVISSISTN